MSNIKENINIVELVQSYIKILNTSCKENNIKKHYSIDIINGKIPSDIRVKDTKEKRKTFKQLKFTIANLETNERITLFSVDYVLKNPADVFNGDYKKVLYKEFLYSTTSLFAITMENFKKQEKAESLIKHKINTENVK